MMIALLILQMKLANERYALQAKWKVFCEKHLIADDPYDEQTRRHKESKEDDNEPGADSSP